MRFIKICCLVLLISGYGCQISNSQPTKGDTVLYLHFDSSKFYKNSNSIGIDPVTLKDNPENRYALDYHLYNGYPLEFVSVHKENALKITDIKKYNVVTPEELKSFISMNYPKDFLGYGGRPYFDHLKDIYMVERSNDKKSYYFTKVRLDITME
ncbi:MAG: hypothetical protein JSU09_13575 [Bacteroidetes bacterium]|nr:hypothetical protein [Bacteroidota bacterium]